MTEVTPVQPQQPGQQDLEEKDQLMSWSVSNKAVYKTAPATPGLLKMVWHLNTNLAKNQAKHMVKELLLAAFYDSFTKLIESIY